MTLARIKAIRTALGVSQEAFARMLGVGVVTINRWEAGRTPVLPLYVEVYKLLDRALKTVPAERIIELSRVSIGRVRFFCKVRAAAGLDSEC